MTDHIFRVTNTSTKASYDEETWEETYPEGSLAWALEQATYYSGDETPVILFTKAVSGKTIKLGTEYPGYGMSEYVHSDVIFRMEEGARPVTIGSVNIDTIGTARHHFENLTIEDGIKLAADIELSGNLTLNGSVVSGSLALDPTSTIAGNDITFSGTRPLTVYLTEWDGSAEGVSSVLDSVFEEGCSYTISSKKAILNVLIDSPSQNITIDDSLLNSLSVDGFSDVQLAPGYLGGQTITLAPGTTWTVCADELTFDGYYYADIDYADVDGSSVCVSGGTLKLEAGSRILGTNGKPASYFVDSYSELKMNGVDLSKTTICGEWDSNVTLTNCKGNATLCPSYADSFTVTGCDLSTTKIVLAGGYDSEEPVIDGQLDFSNNYWGTSNLSQICKKFTYTYYVYDEDGMITSIKTKTLDAFYFVSENNPDGFINLGTLLTRSDVTAPTLTINKAEILSTDLETNTASVKFSWAGAKGANYTYQLYVKGEEITLDDDTATSQVVEGVEDGEKISYTVIATNVTGFSTTKSGTFGFDATAPELTLSEDPVSVANRRSGKAQVTLVWESSEANVTYQVFLDGSAKAAYKGNKPTCNIRNVADGEHSYRIIATDKAGNVSEEVGGTFTFDATAPVVTLSTPTIEYTEQGAGGNVTLYADSNEEGVTYTVLLNNKPVEGIDPTVSGFSLGTLKDGRYTYSITATDAEGNVSKKMQGSFTVDSSDLTPPEAPTDAVISSRKMGENKSTITLKWKAPLDPATGRADRIASYEVKVLDEAGEVINTIISRSTTCNITGMADGAYSFAITAVDKAGNQGETLTTDPYVTDTVAPEVAALTGFIHQGATGSKASGASLSWKGEEGASYIVKLGGKTLTFTQGEDGIYSATYKVGRESYTCTLESPADGILTYTHPFALKDGKYTYSVTAIDASGNKKEYKGASALVADTTAAAAPRLGRVTQVGTEDGMVQTTLTWTGEKGASYVLKVDGEAVELADPTATSCTLKLTDGAHSWSVQAIDAYGNTSEKSIATSRKPITYDATAPSMVLNGAEAVSYNARTGAITLSLSWAGGEAKNITYRLVDKDTGKQLYRGARTTCKLTVAAGTHTYELIATDKAGNSSVITNQLSFNPEAAEESGILSWVGNGAPESSTELGWADENTSGFDGNLGASETFYTLQVSDAVDAKVSLSAHESAVGVKLYDADGVQIGAAQATAGTALDQQLTLSAGTYYLGLSGAEGAAYTLDLDLRQGHTTRQGVLAGAAL